MLPDHNSNYNSKLTKVEAGATIQDPTDGVFTGYALFDSNSREIGFHRQDNRFTTISDRVIDSFSEAGNVYEPRHILAGNIAELLDEDTGTKFQPEEAPKASNTATFQAATTSQTGTTIQLPETIHVVARDYGEGEVPDRVSEGHPLARFVTSTSYNDDRPVSLSFADRSGRFPDICGPSHGQMAYNRR